MRLGFWQKTAVFATTAAVGVTGLLWLILHDMIDDEPGDAARILLILHGVSSYAILVVVGSLLPRHVRSGWVRRRNMVTGLTVTAVMAVLAVTGLGLYYGGEDLHAPVKWLHVVFGLGCFALFPAHAFLAARSQRSSQAATADGSATPPPELAAGPG
jgi:drug/metabolite transporter (DMT)-like permease